MSRIWYLRRLRTSATLSLINRVIGALYGIYRGRKIGEDGWERGWMEKDEPGPERAVCELRLSKQFLSTGFHSSRNDVRSNT